MPAVRRDGSVPVQFSVRVLASTIPVELDDSVPLEARDRIIRQWAHLRVDDPPSGAGSIRVYGPGGEPDARADPAGPVTHIPALNPDVIPDQLAGSLTLTGLQELFGKALLLHAAGLATADGSVIALIGPSGAGKTTASRVLGQTMQYVSDETVAIRLDGAVISYPKPLSIGRRPRPKALFAPAEVGLTVAHGPLHLGALVLLQREPGRPDVQIEAIALGDALSEIAPESSSLAEIPSVLQRVAGLIAQTGGVRRVRYGDAEQLPTVIEQILTTRGEPENIEPVNVATPEASGPDTIRRAPFADAATVGDRLIVLGQRALCVLDGLGAAVWRAADGVTISQLTERVLETIGDPPAGVDPQPMVETTVHQLIEADLLVADSVQEH